MRILGLDYGSRTVGVAVSDGLMITAQGLETIERKKENQLRRTLARIETICKEYEVNKIVLGFPKNMDNSIGEQAERVTQFKETLERRTGLEVVLWDERLTTVSAKRVLNESNIRGREEQKKVIDKIAAVFILQGYLDSCR
ncbi:MAG: Holliday junction resolvase RuvX [Lachnospiraceae bacterium]|nr:Holliday junction resolvase RuvX [Lachnospiraceae bacterium]